MCVNRPGQRGFKWENASEDARLPTQWWAAWDAFRARITRHMLAWLNRFAIDSDGVPLAIRVVTADELAEMEQPSSYAVAESYLVAGLTSSHLTEGTTPSYFTDGTTPSYLAED